VTARLPDADIVHFSCHGYSHPGDRSQSLLLLHAPNPLLSAPASDAAQPVLAGQPRAAAE